MHPAVAIIPCELPGLDSEAIILRKVTTRKHGKIQDVPHLAVDTMPLTIVVNALFFALTLHSNAASAVLQ